jgi:stalled ribosome rescue protein Dom34
MNLERDLLWVANDISFQVETWTDLFTAVFIRKQTDLIHYKEKRQEKDKLDLKALMTVTFQIVLKILKFSVRMFSTFPLIFLTSFTKYKI